MPQVRKSSLETMISKSDRCCNQREFPRLMMSEIYDRARKFNLLCMLNVIYEGVEK